MKKIILLLLIIVSFVEMHAQNGSPWKKISQSRIAVSERIHSKIDAANQLVFELDEVSMKQSLASIQGKAAKENGTVIDIPNKNGVVEKFSVWESSNFAPELQAQYSDIRAYEGVGISDPNASINFSFSPQGIQTMVLRGENDTEFIEKYSQGSTAYVVFDSKSRKRGSLPFSCKTEDVLVNEQMLSKTSKIVASNGVYKTFRLALSCTAEYTSYHGGTVAGALAAMNATMTRVNGIFNKDLALRLIIIANNSSIIYTNATTDPYSDAVIDDPNNTITDGSEGAWSLELQDNLTTTIGNANYDIGHLFGASGSGGNAGCIGCICVAPSIADEYGKGSAFTSPADEKPEGDTFDIDFVAHEMGHQLGANHTFSDVIEGEGVSVEPGGGSTIMGYAGITDYSVQNNSDDYFAYASIRQIQVNLAAKSCGTNQTLSNQTPTMNAGADYTIPKGTAFVLKGTGSDPNGNALTYCWEQNDSATTQSGASSIAFSTKPDGPLFRSFKPVSSPVRYMPALNSVLANKLTSTWESVSDIARTLHFTLTGRDNAAQGVAQTSTDAMIVSVSGTAGPFAVTSQNTDNLSWSQGTGQTITWSVNNTASLQGSANVNIKLSIDGGLTFPTVLAANTPNDGSETITVPAIQATNCRILIEPTDNIYYAVNSKSFAVGYSVTSTCNTYTFSTPINIPDGTTSYTIRTITVPSSTSTTVSDVNFAVGFTHTYLSDVQIELSSPEGTTVKLFDRGCGSTSNTLLLNYDDSGSALSCGTTTLQTVAPFEPLGVLNGQNPSGVWTLRVRDVDAVKTGRIDSASITICTQTFTLGTPDLEINDFVMYPNPNKGNFNIQFSSTSSTGVAVFVHDILGRKIYEKKFENASNFNQNIQLTNAQAGIYLLTVIDGDRKEVRKIVIE